MRGSVDAGAQVNLGEEFLIGMKECCFHTGGGVNQVRKGWWRQRVCNRVSVERERKAARFPQEPSDSVGNTGTVPGSPETVPKWGKCAFGDLCR